MLIRSCRHIGTNFDFLTARGHVQMHVQMRYAVCGSKAGTFSKWEDRESVGLGEVGIKPRVSKLNIESSRVQIIP